MDDGGSDGPTPHARSSSVLPTPRGHSQEREHRAGSSEHTIRDAVALAGTTVRLARLAIYDKVEGIELGAGLEGYKPVEPAALAAFVDSRLAAE